MEILEVLKYTLPALIVFLTAYFIIHSFVKNDQERRRNEIRMLNQKTITPIRLQAYERIVLFLERISPESLIMRLNDPKIPSGQLQSDLLSAIRAEFEHNLSQQIYISNHAWEVVKSAKSNVIKIINSAADKIKPDSPSFELSKAILESMMEVNKSPNMVAIEFLKREMEQFL
ncbi:MAG: hypothetical protein JXB17_04075 [Bacteroidales bacterium]|nr:hypothetical protein [Bacteroidales bacterium]